MIGRGASVLALALVACVGPESERCADGAVCPRGMVCAPADLGTSCIPAHCGDGEVDPGEACDDGNLIGGDGCADDCSSDERCGNGVKDPAEDCDDGNRRNHDSCSETCHGERLEWSSFDELPDARGGAAAAYDPRRGVVVLFGGCTEPDGATGTCRGALLGDTWEWDGGRWRARPSPNAPMARSGHAMAYDAAHQQVVLFGGCTHWSADGACATLRDDTWTWDGVAWSPTPTSGQPPPARSGHALAYDATRARVILFGGIVMAAGAPAAAADTWEWDGARWLPEGLSAVPPPARSRHAMTYDPLRRRIVMFGGRDASAGLGDTWEWDGARWEERRSAIAPAARFGHAMAYDATRGEVVLGPGCGDPDPQAYAASCAGPAGSLWTRGAAGWRSTEPVRPPSVNADVVRPAPGADYTFAGDAARARVVRFGGLARAPASGALAPVAETWEWDGGRWERRTPAAAPPLVDAPPGVATTTVPLAYDAVHAVSVGVAIDGDDSSTWSWAGAWRRQPTPFGGPTKLGAAMAYDLGSRRITLVAGDEADPRAPPYDLWQWDGTLWIGRGANPPPRRDPAVAYDVDHRRLLMFGGNDGADLDDLWEWDGSSWRRRDVTPPPARSQAAMAYDLAHHRIVLFGGRIAGEPEVWLSDLWTWDGEAWEEVAATTNTTARAGHALAYDPLRGRLVLFGGSAGGEPLHDTQEWDGHAWTPIATDAVPPPARRVAMTYDAARHGMLLYQGDGGGPGATWLLSSESAVLDERCATGFDADADGLVGCADPDCGSLCDPLCTVAAICDGERPRCGDGSCSDLEGCRLCPADCGACPAVCGDFVCDPGEGDACPADCGTR